MRLLEAIMDVNQCAVASGAKPELNLPEFSGALPLISLTCIDARLNRLIPEMLGVPEAQFIWLRNAGNIIFDPMSTMMRTLALACAIKGGREIAIIGHTDCQVCKTTVLKLTEAFHTLGVDRAKLPENLTEFFGLFASERQNVLRGAEIVRKSPLIGTKIPVHGLLIDLPTGRLEWVLNGYQTLSATQPELPENTSQTSIGMLAQAAAGKLDTLSAKLSEFHLGDMQFPDFKIGETAIDPNKWLTQVEEVIKPQRIETPVVATSQTPVVEPGRKFDQSRKYKIIGSDQKVYGPVAGFKLVEWIADGRINWKTAAQLDGSSEWKPLSDWAVSTTSLPIPQPPPIQSQSRIASSKTRQR